MRRILVIADDLSGAAEIAGIGKRHGLAVRLQRDAPVVAREGMTVLDTDTRLVPQDEASEQVRRAVRHLRPGDFDLIYKKTDSAFRGPLLGELDALMDACGRRAAVLVAQNPSRGRTIRDGEYRIDGVPLAQTTFAHDPEYPARTSNALHLLGKCGQRQVRRAAASDGRGGGAAADGVTIGEASDLAEVRRWAASVAADTLPAGGADFFQAILEARGLSATHPQLAALPPGRTLIVCGTSPAFSAGPVGRAQAEGVAVCPMPDHSLGAVASLDAWQAAARQALDAAGRALIVIQRPLDRSPGAPQRFQAALAEVVGRLLATPGGADNLLLEGGATASAVCRRMNWHHFDLEGEFAPGVVQMRALPTDGSTGHRLVIKPGSYPWPEAVWSRPGKDGVAQT
jgi:D-threonate/D-erythronate kinase